MLFYITLFTVYQKLYMNEIILSVHILSNSNFIRRRSVSGLGGGAESGMGEGDKN